MRVVPFSASCCVSETCVLVFLFPVPLIIGHDYMEPIVGNVLTCGCGGRLVIMSWPTFDI